MGKIAAAATAAAATAAVAVVAVNDAIAIAGAAVVAGDAGVEEADPVAAVADDAFVFLAHANPFVCSSVAKCRLCLQSSMLTSKIFF